MLAAVPMRRLRDARACVRSPSAARAAALASSRRHAFMRAGRVRAAFTTSTVAAGRMGAKRASTCRAGGRQPWCCCSPTPEGWNGALEDAAANSRHAARSSSASICRPT
jgi:hypothetical protein